MRKIPGDPFFSTKTERNTHTFPYFSHFLRGAVFFSLAEKNHSSPLRRPLTLMEEKEEERNGRPFATYAGTNNCTRFLISLFNVSDLEGNSCECVSDPSNKTTPARRPSESENWATAAGLFLWRRGGGGADATVSQKNVKEKRTPGYLASASAAATNRHRPTHKCWEMEGGNYFAPERSVDNEGGRRAHWDGHLSTFFLLFLECPILPR